MLRNRMKKQVKPNKIKTPVFSLILYIYLITLYLILRGVKTISSRLKFLSGLERALSKYVYAVDRRKRSNFSKMELIDLAFKNMFYKKKRTYVTIGGMAIGIASIVLLVSIGYGLQALVIDRVARLEELKQADVSVLPGSNLLLNNETYDSFGKIDHVTMVLPHIAVAGKVNYNNSLIDTAVYGVTKSYLEQSAISPFIGKIFDNNLIETDITATIEETTEEQTVDSFELPSGWVIVEGESNLGSAITTSKILFPEEIEDKEIIVNKAFLRVLDLQESEALDTQINISFVATQSTLLSSQDRLESTAVEYTVIGVTPDDITPLVYIPFTHLKALGIDNFSQIKVVVDDEANLQSVRNEIESKGYATASVADTVDQINQLFSVARIFLASLGAIALAVAALGMFNTLTVSLLERFREVGLLKTMGMKSSEIRDLFLAESMTMGLSGGFLGLLFGIIIGKLIEFGVSLYAISQNIGAITLVDVPIIFAVFVIFLSFGVGIVTGIYPAKQATKISALNALRYE
jgi:putative ABC transport system permease protein